MTYNRVDRSLPSRPQEPSAPEAAETVPTPSSRLLPWERILIRTGFHAKLTKDGTFDLSAEESYNRDFFSRLLERLDLADQFDGFVFRPADDRFDEDLWLAAHEQCHGRAEGAPSHEQGFQRMRLDLMDTYLSGFLRWINYIGIRTVVSCDGHGVRWPLVQLPDQARDSEFLDLILTLISKGHLDYGRNGRYYLRPKPGRRSGPRRGIASRPRIPSGFRLQFLDYAKTLHRHREALRTALEGLKSLREDLVFEGTNALSAL